MFHHMKLYTVHVRPDEPASHQKPVFVREGFNIFAFVLTVFWALYQRLWLQAAVLLAINIALISMRLHHTLNPLSMIILQLGYQSVIGFSANDWVRHRLARKGYIMTDVSAGDSLLRAEQRYFERYLASA